MVCYTFHMNSASLAVILCALAAPWSQPTLAEETADYLNTVTYQEKSAPDAWARPLPGKPIRVLVVAPRYTLMDAARLGEQLEIDLRVAPTFSNTALGYNTAGAPPFDGGAEEETLDRLEDELNARLDVIVIGNLDLSLLPESLRDQLIEKVRDGAGLVLAHYEDGLPGDLAQFLSDAEPSSGHEDIVRGLGRELVPEWQAGISSVATSTIGDGRIVEFQYPGPAPATHCLFPTLDGASLIHESLHRSYEGLIVRAVRWAANRDPEIRITEAAYMGGEAPDDVDIPPLMPEFVEMMKEQAVHQSARRYMMRIDPPAPAPYEVMAQVREPSPRPPIQIAAPGAAPPYRSGTYGFPIYAFGGSDRFFYDFWLLHREQVVEWRTEAMDIDAHPAIESVRFDRKALRPFDTLNVAVTLGSRLYQAKSAAVYVRAVDPLNRVVADAQALVPGSEGTANLSLALDDLIQPRLRIEIYTNETETPQNLQANLFFANYDAYSLPVLLEPEGNSFLFAAKWDGPLEPNVGRALNALRRIGVNAALVNRSAQAPFYMADRGLFPIPPLLRDGEHVGALTPAVVRDRLNEAALYGAQNLWIDDPTADLPMDDQVFAVQDVGPPVHDEARTLLGLPGRIPETLNEARWLPWHAALSGADGLLVDTPYGTKDQTHLHTAIAPDGRTTPAIDAIADSVTQIRRGYDSLLQKAAPLRSGIAIYDGGRPGAVLRWNAYLQRLGYAPARLSPEAVSAGAAVQFDVLVLPVAELLDKETVRAIARFAAQGGALIADTMPHTMNDESAEAMEFLFGVQLGSGNAGETPDPIVLERDDDTTRTVPDVERYEPWLEADASALAPGAWFLNESGAAPTLLFNHRLPDSPGDWMYVLDDRLQAMGAVKSTPYEPADSDAMEGRLFAFEYGAAKIFAALADPHGDGMRGTLHLDKDLTVYNMAEGINEFRAKRTSIRLKPADVAMYAALPYEVDNVLLAADEAVHAGTRLHIAVQVQSDDNTVGAHVVYVALRPLGGESLPHHRLSIQCPAGTGKSFIPLALNEAGGWYELTARDVLSGATSSIQLQILPRKPLS